MRWDGGTLIWSPTWDRSAMTTHGPCCVSIKAEAFRSAVRDCGGTIEIIDGYLIGTIDTSPQPTEAP